MGKCMVALTSLPTAQIASLCSCECTDCQFAHFGDCQFAHPGSSLSHKSATHLGINTSDKDPKWFNLYEQKLPLNGVRLQGRKQKSTPKWCKSLVEGKWM